MTHPLAPFRQRIDELDDEIVRLLAQRFDIVRQVAAVKRAEGIPSVLPERIEQVKDRAAAAGAPLGLNPDFMRRLYALVIAEACRMEDEMMEGPPPGRAAADRS